MRKKFLLRNECLKYLLIVVIAFMVTGLASCKTKVPPVEEILCPGCKQSGEIHGKCSVCGGYVCVGDHTHKPQIELPDPSSITIGISGESEVKTGHSIQLQAVVTLKEETEKVIDKTVTWEIASGNEFASISSDGILSANEVNGDKVIEVVAKSNANLEAKATKVITIVSRTELTQSMLDVLNVDKIGFEGYVAINLYTIGLFEQFHSAHTTVVKTAMDGTNWYAEYENATTGIKQGIYYENHNDLACQVGVNFMNEELYNPMTDDNGAKISWIHSGLYNNFKGLKVSDFTFNDENWRYEYTGNDSNFIFRVAASANPYDFVPLNLSLIIDEGEIIGIRSKGEDSYTIAQGYRAEQELTVVINTDNTVEVPTIAKYQHDPIHDALNEAIQNMQQLDSYVLDFKEITASYLTSGYTESGYRELITTNNCLFTPYSVAYKNQEEIHTPLENANYGYKKISEMLYNTYIQDENGYQATRAYEKEFTNAKPSFAFAGEIFTKYYIDKEEGSTTYYVDNLMSAVASTFYYGVGNDINLYGIFATEGKTSETTSFTPYVVVKDGYIIEAGFYFYMGSIYGVVELKYSDFNETTIPVEEVIEFETRQVPTSWNELTIQVSEGTGSGTADDITVNALDYLKKLYGNENIEDIMPFFGDPLGDTYGFGLTTVYMPGGSNWAREAVVFYYDVPLDIDYTISTSLEAIEIYLLNLGFTKNEYDEFEKDGICVAPVDSNLDLMIYVYKK